MAGRLANKVAIVTGAGSIGPGWGNGKATAVLYAREGAKVVTSDINAEAARDTARIITDEGGEATLSFKRSPIPYVSRSWSSSPASLASSSAFM